jgi:hypothetical protein
VHALLRESEVRFSESGLLRFVQDPHNNKKPYRIPVVSQIHRMAVLNLGGTTSRGVGL